MVKYRVVFRCIVTDIEQRETVIIIGMSKVRQLRMFAGGVYLVAADRLSLSKFLEEHLELLLM